MHSASEEWVARVAARNEIEMAKARRGLRAVPLSAGANSADGRDARRTREGGAE